MFGCLLEIECSVSTYCFHGDVCNRNIIYKTGYHTLPGLYLFALTAAPLLNSWQKTLSYCSSHVPIWHFKLYLLSRSPTSYLSVQTENLWSSVSLSRRKGKGRWDTPDHIFTVDVERILNLWDSEEDFPNTNVRELCVYAVRGKALHLLSDLIKKERETGRNNHMHFKQIFVNTESEVSIVCRIIGT